MGAPGQFVTEDTQGLQGYPGRPLGLPAKQPFCPWSPSPTPTFRSLWLAGSEEESGGQILA